MSIELSYLLMEATFVVYSFRRTLNHIRKFFLGKSIPPPFKKISPSFGATKLSDVQQFRWCTARSGTKSGTTIAKCCVSSGAGAGATTGNTSIF
jgi:hypothetical protein